MQNTFDTVASNAILGIIQSLTPAEKESLIVEVDNLQKIVYTRGYMIGLKMKTLRKERGMTLKKLEAVSGISFVTLITIEKEKNKNPTLKTLKAIAEALDVPVYYFL